MVRRALTTGLGGVAAVLCLPHPLAAHTGRPPAPHDLWTAWSLEPGVLLALVVGAVLYAAGVRSAWRQAGRGRVFGTRQIRAGVLALVTLGLALLSPLDAVSAALFSAHMVQHLLLIAVVAPLLITADVLHAMLRALPLRSRRSLTHGLRRTGVWDAWRSLALPLPALVLHVGVLWLWHLPRYYDAAVQVESLHTLEHITLVASAALFWRPVLASARALRMSPGFALLYIFFFGMQAALLGALLTFAGQPWFSAHLDSVAAWGLTPIADQRLAGVIMWVPGGVLDLAAAARVFLRWMNELEARTPAAARLAS